MSNRKPTKNQASSISGINSLSYMSNRGASNTSVKSESFTRGALLNSSFKELKRDYNMKKRCFSQNIRSAIESTQEVHSGWLKARTKFKHWTKVWCQVKPGYLIIYTSQEAQKKHRLGVVLLSICKVIQRPTKREGFCFKLINPFGCSVWAKFSTKALVFSQASLTLRSSDGSIGKLWLDALRQCNLSANLEGYIVMDEVIDENERMGCNLSELSDSEDDGDNSTGHLGSISLSNSTSNNNSINSSINNYPSGSGRPFINGNSKSLKISQNNSTYKLGGSDDLSCKNVITNPNKERSTSQLGGKHRFNNSNNNEIVKQGKEFRESKSATDYNGNHRTCSSPNSSKMVIKFSKYNWKELQLENVEFVGDEAEELGCAGIQSEEVLESNKNFLWHIIKQLRPGMDLSKVTLPTFILEPRSFLEKLADYYYHCDLLSEAVLVDDPVMRLVNIVKWYLSGFYKKPKGPKKPYNPILGEKFRCFWDHPKTQSRTFFVAEQVSHHPPISVFHVTNRKDGYTLTCSLLSRSKFSGNSVSAILDGKARLFLNKRGETYTLTMPYANCRGILLGSLCLELGGKVEIECVETGCKCELDFKLASVWGGSNSYNLLTGRVFKSNRVTHTLEGHWDRKITITDKRSDEKSILWEVTDVVRNSRLKRYTVAIRDQGERESVKLWSKVSDALQSGDQTLATTEKTRLEDMQRLEARERKTTFVPGHFVNQSGDWTYKWIDDRPWNDCRDIMQFEDDFKIRTLIVGSGISSRSNSSAQPSIPALDPIIDLPVTKLNKLSSTDQSKAKQTHVFLRDIEPLQSEKNHLDPDAYKSIESKINNENMLIKEAIKQVTEQNKKLEEDLAVLKRGKRAVALIMAVFIAIILSVFFKHL